MADFRRDSSVSLERFLPGYDVREQSPIGSGDHGRRHRGAGDGARVCVQSAGYEHNFFFGHDGHRQ